MDVPESCEVRDNENTMCLKSSIFLFRVSCWMWLSESHLI